jgi:glucosamine 6-phosphate synthetase-like amidotransferase/phosphosugar isomerase protein
MCGVFGFVSFDGKGPNIKRLEAIARVTMSRGAHAFGFAWIDGKGRLRMFKQAGRIVDYLGLLAMASDARMLIGHCRYATHGSYGNNLNNHPHPADGGWIVHNGVISRNKAIVEENDLHPVTDCDSEVLGMLIEQGEGTLQKRCIKAVQTVGGSPLVMLGLWSRPGRLMALRNGNPLSLGMVDDGQRVYLGSLREGLPGKIVDVSDGDCVDFSATGMKTVSFSTVSIQEIPAGSGMGFSCETEQWELPF